MSQTSIHEDHGHGHDGHDHGHGGHGGQGSHAGHHHHTGPADTSRPRVALRFALAGLVALGAVIAACMVMVPAGEAVVITRFGDPMRVLTRPGLAWKLPLPIETTVPVDLRLRTTSTGTQDVGTRDGLRVLVQAFVAWQVPTDPARVIQFLRAVRNAPDEAAAQLRSFVGASLHVTASSFDLADLVNTDPAKVRLDAFEARLREQIAARVLDIYGVTVREVGIERLSLPAETLAATVARMKAERETVAAERTAEGLRAAAAIRSDAERDARVVVAQSRTEAAKIEADAQVQAAEIQSRSYRAAPKLYMMLRSLDTIGAVVGPNTRVILRTDAAPFHVLVEGPPGSTPGNAPASAPEIAPGRTPESPADAPRASAGDAGR